MIKCPSCGRENISDDAVFCSYCGRPLEVEKEQVNQEEPIEVPKEKKDRFWIPVAIILAVIVLSVVLMIILDDKTPYTNTTPVSVASSKPTPTPIPVPKVKILNQEIHSNYLDSDDYMLAEADIKNNSNITLYYVKVNLEIMDEDKNILDTEWTFAVSNEGIRPGAQAHFDIMFKKIEGAEWYRMYVVDYDW